MALKNEKILDSCKMEDASIEIVQMEELNGAKSGAMSQ